MSPQQPSSGGQQNNQQRQPMINGNTAWTLESVLAPPGHPGGGGGTQQLATATGQSVEKIREAIPLLRDPRYHIASINTNGDGRRITVLVRPSASRAGSSTSSTQRQQSQQQQPPRTEYTFTITLSDDRRQISKVDMAIHSSES